MAPKSTKKKTVKKGYYKEGGQWVYYGNGKKLKGLDILTYHITNQSEKSIPAAVRDALVNAGQDLLLLPQGSKYTSGGKPVSALDAKYAKERGIKLDPLQTEVFPTKNLDLAGSSEYAIKLSKLETNPFDSSQPFDPFRFNESLDFNTVEEEIAQNNEKLTKDQKVSDQKSTIVTKTNNPVAPNEGDVDTKTVLNTQKDANKDKLKSTAIPEVWNRFDGSGRKLSDVNTETENALKARGFNIDRLRVRGLDKNDILADVRSGRATFLKKDRLLVGNQIIRAEGT